jgi:hypothetical protein
MYRVLFSTYILLIMAFIDSNDYYERRGATEGVLRDAVNPSLEAAGKWS